MANLALFTPFHKCNVMKVLILGGRRVLRPIPGRRAQGGSDEARRLEWCRNAIDSHCGQCGNAICHGFRYLDMLLNHFIGDIT